MGILSRSGLGPPAHGYAPPGRADVGDIRRRSADFQEAPALLALALRAFSVGTTELVVVGLLPEVADALRVTVKTCQLRSCSFLYYCICAANGNVRHPPIVQNTFP
jgi:hypothetical protein